MKAAYIDRPDVLKFGDLLDPKAAAGVVIVDVHAASVNAADWKFRAGEYARHAGPLPGEPPTSEPIRVRDRQFSAWGPLQ